MNGRTPKPDGLFTQAAQPDVNVGPNTAFGGKARERASCRAVAASPDILAAHMDWMVDYVPAVK
jgi:hypothetical protein